MTFNTLFFLNFSLIYARTIRTLLNNFQNSCPNSWNYDQLGYDWTGGACDQCNGLNQSPINLQTNSNNNFYLSPEDDPFMAQKIVNEYFLSNKMYDIEVSDISHKGDLHALKVIFKPEIVIKFQSNQNKNSLFHQKCHHAHFHLGTSEHTLDGRYFDGEMHIVCYDGKFPDVKSVLKEPKGRSNLRVLGFFLRKVNRSTFLSRQLKDVFFDDRKQITLINRNSWPGSQFLSAFRYYGSLTTPTCNEMVAWTVFTDPIDIDGNFLQYLKQITDFSNQKKSNSNLGGKIVVFGNSRALQELNGREVEVLGGFDGQTNSFVPNNFKNVQVHQEDWWSKMMQYLVLEYITNREK